ncbi:DNA-directed RNA polymerase subunit beta [bacterium]|nr:DNA-directed RNA polymerase subunit beta [bacterium]
MSTLLNKKVFSTYKRPAFKERSLIEVQKDSFDWFLEDGLRELFDEISPIQDHTGEELELHFLDYTFDKPKYTEEQAKAKDQTYESSLRVKLKLTDTKRNTKDVQEVYLGDFPMMTDRGTFIINGVDRVVISQIVRSPGAYFLMKVFRGRKFFGAKIIPNRGSWLEFDTDPDGFLGVRIDRKRKTPVTQLLRIFGFETNEEILEAFKDVDTGEVNHIEATLKKDDVEDAAQSYVEIYRRLRPGDLATAENAQSLIDAMFQRFDRYDLSKVGRFKLNQRLGLSDKKEGGLLDKEDIVGVLKEIIRLNNNIEAGPDDIDHLGNRRVRAVGELVQSRLRVGFARLRRGVQDRMSTIERDELQPVQLVNYKVLSAVVRDFFSSSQLSQFMDQVNPLAELEHKRRLSAMGPGGLTRERAGFEVRDVHPSYYGRICPIQTPEGANIGLVSYLASHTRLNEFGFLETPYYRVEDGVVTSKLDWLDAIKDEEYNIAQADVRLDDNGKILEDNVSARIKGRAGTCLREDVDYMDVSPDQFTSIAASLIPFLEHNDANRALMGSNMQRQAVPSIVPEAPLVGTGREEKAAQDSQQVILSGVNGRVSAVEADGIDVKASGGIIHSYPLVKFVRSNQSTCLSQRPVVSVGDKVKKGDVLADGPATDNGVLALGQNLVVAFVPWRGANFEDAIVLSERVAQHDRFTSIHIETFVCAVRDTKLGPEVTTPDIPNVSEDKLRNLDEEGVVRIGAEVRSNDILVGKISPKGESELTSEERLLRAIFGEKARDVKDSSLTVPHGKKGRVIGVKIFSREKGDKLEPGIIQKIQIEVAQLRKIRAGDKLTGRYGNKGVISQVRPVEDMPYLEDGTPVDVVLNPLGVPSRMNLGQILEIHTGFAAKLNGYRAVVPNFVGATEDDIRKELEEAGVSPEGKVTLYDGVTGQCFREKIAVGVMYVMKLNHLVEDKIHMRSTGPYSLITQQPLGGKAQLGGQRFGEMEVWALEGYGAAHTLQEMLTIKSDDVLGRASAFESIIRGREIRKPNIPASFNVLVSELKSLGLSVGYEGKSIDEGEEDGAEDGKEEQAEEETKTEENKKEVGSTN